MNPTYRIPKSGEKKKEKKSPVITSDEITEHINLFLEAGGRIQEIPMGHGVNGLNPIVTLTTRQKQNISI